LIQQKTKTYEHDYFYSCRLRSNSKRHLPGGKGAAMNHYEVKVREMLKTIQDVHVCDEETAVLMLQYDLNIDLNSVQKLLLELLKIKENLFTDKQ